MSFNQLYSTIQKNIKGGGFGTMMKKTEEEDNIGEGFCTSGRYSGTSGISSSDLNKLRTDLETKINNVERKIPNITPIQTSLSDMSSKLGRIVLPAGSSTVTFTTSGSATISGSSPGEVGTIIAYSGAISVSTLPLSPTLAADNIRYKADTMELATNIGGDKNYINIPDGYLLCDGTKIKKSIRAAADPTTVIFKSLVDIIGTSFSNDTPIAKRATYANQSSTTATDFGAISMASPPTIQLAGPIVTDSATSSGYVTVAGEIAGITIQIASTDYTFTGKISGRLDGTTSGTHSNLKLSCVYSPSTPLTNVLDITLTHQKDDSSDVVVFKCKYGCTLDIQVSSNVLATPAQCPSDQCAFDHTIVPANLHAIEVNRREIRLPDLQNLFIRGYNPANAIDFGLRKDDKIKSHRHYIMTRCWPTNVVPKASSTISAADNSVRQLLLNNTFESLRSDLLDGSGNVKNTTVNIKVDASTSVKNLSSSSSIDFNPSNYLIKNTAGDISIRSIKGANFLYSPLSNVNMASTGTENTKDSHSYDLFYPFINEEPNAGLTSGVIHGNINASNNKHPIVDSDETYPKHMALTYLIKYK